MRYFKRKVVEKHGKNCDNLLCQSKSCQPSEVKYKRILKELRKELA